MFTRQPKEAVMGIARASDLKGIPLSPEIPNVTKQEQIFFEEISNDEAKAQTEGN
jgi:hypothetical protein